ncbi:MAG: cell division protein ZapA (FtsZ GTPase activity inhibitor) [Paraglaciecola sp.]|jgi:cell division protein ZapA (FtsZ GTPase activity inhibitor)
MENTTHKQLTITIAGRPYPLKIKASDEPVLRKIVKEVNEKINRFRLAYPKRDMQDCIAMATLAYAVDLHKARQGTATTNTATAKAAAATPTVSTEIERKIAQLDELLDNLL